MTGFDWTSVKDVVEFPIASAAESFYLAEGGHTVSLRGLRVTRGFSDGLEISVVAGRRLTEQDFAAGSEPVALIGHSLWRDRFGSEPSAIGRLIRAEAESGSERSDTFRIVGVLAPGFYYGSDSRAALELLVPHTSPLRAGSVTVSDGYFASFGIPMREGREFTAQESSVAAPVAVLSETLAERLWPAGGAVGRRVREVEQTPVGSTPGPWRTVVGIARDVRQSYDDTDQGDFYAAGTSRGRFATFYLRTRQPAAPLFEAFRTAASEVDSTAVISPPRLLMDDDKALAATMFLSVLLTGFAGVAAFLAMLGIYGVTAYAVAQRHKEVAIRLALGASAHAVVRMFLREGALLLGVGTLLGLSGGAAGSWVLGSRIFGVQSFDPATYLLASALLLGAGFMTVFVAARGAAISNPVGALTGS